MYKVYCLVGDLNVSEKFDDNCELVVSDGVLIVSKERKTLAKFAAGFWQYYKLIKEENTEGNV